MLLCGGVLDGELTNRTYIVYCDGRVVECEDMSIGCLGHTLVYLGEDEDGDESVLCIGGSGRDREKLSSVFRYSINKDRWTQ